ncbi:unnamed protein product, partial [marine sediment metagenome]
DFPNFPVPKSAQTTRSKKEKAFRTPKSARSQKLVNPKKRENDFLVKAHTPFELPDFLFPVPFGMEKHLSVVLQRTYRVEVEWMREDGTKEKANGFDLKVATKDGEVPEMTSEELCQVCLAIGYLHFEEEEAQEERKYRVRQYWKDDKGKDRRKFWPFKVRPAGEVAGSGQMGHQQPVDPNAYGGIEEPGEGRWESSQRQTERTQRMLVDANGMVMRQVDMTLTTILKANSSVLGEQRLMNEENRIALRESRDQTSKAQDRLFKMAIAL